MIIYGGGRQGGKLFLAEQWERKKRSYVRIPTGRCWKCNVIDNINNLAYIDDPESGCEYLCFSCYYELFPRALNDFEEWSNCSHE